MLKVELFRGGLLESTHFVHARVETADRTVLLNTSEDFEFFPRSAIKPFQSFLLLRSGAYENFNLNLQHLALASASHAGEKEHTDLVASWLSKLGLTESHLQCGAHWPSNLDASQFLRENKQTPSAIHNNCSGKHTGFLTVCSHLKLPFETYHQIQHPVQQKLKQIIENELDDQLRDYGIDGCSIPAFRMSFHKLSYAFARLGQRAVADAQSAEALVLEAFKAYPHLTSGKEQYCTQIMLKNSGRLIAKGGAEGIVAGVIPGKQMSVLVKCQDGSHRGSQNAFDYLIQKFAGLEPGWTPQITNWVGATVGDVRVSIE